MLAKLEMELAGVGVKRINIELQKRFNHRTLEAIKCHRRLPEYKTFLQQYDDRSQDISGNRSNRDNDTDTVQDRIIPDIKSDWKKLAEAELQLTVKEKKRINLVLHDHFPAQKNKKYFTISNIFAIPSNLRNPSSQSS